MAHRNGIPPVAPLFLHFPEDELLNFVHLNAKQVMNECLRRQIIVFLSFLEYNNQYTLSFVHLIVHVWSRYTCHASLKRK